MSTLVTTASAATAPSMQLFILGPQNLFNTNGSLIQFYDSAIPYEFYNNGTNPIINNTYITR